MSDFGPGMVWLVGAGPGDPELLTRKAERLIRSATVVFHDALVGPGVVALVPPGVRLVSVGKRSGRHSKDQRTIDALIVEAALAGERVVRLKGGDPAIFARLGEEIAAVTNAGFGYEIVPGITTASAAAACAGMSLTERGVARRVQFVTAHARAGQALNLDWKSLADPQCTTVLYMARAAAQEISRELIAHGLAGTTPALLMTDVSRVSQNACETSVAAFPDAIQRLPTNAPLIVVIGSVTRLNYVRNEFDLPDALRG